MHAIRRYNNVDDSGGGLMKFSMRCVISFRHTGISVTNSPLQRGPRTAIRWVELWEVDPRSSQVNTIRDVVNTAFVAKRQKIPSRLFSSAPLMPNLHRPTRRDKTVLLRRVRLGSVNSAPGSLCMCMPTVRITTVHTWWYLCQILTDFQNSFTGRFPSKFAVNGY